MTLVTMTTASNNNSTAEDPAIQEITNGNTIETNINHLSSEKNGKIPALTTKFCMNRWNMILGMIMMMFPFLNLNLAQRKTPFLSISALQENSLTNQVESK